MKKFIFLFLIVALSGCDVCDKVKNKFVKKEKENLFLIADKKEADIDNFKVIKTLYDNAYLTDVGYIVYTGIGKVKTTYAFTKFMTLYQDNVKAIFNIGTAGATTNNKFGDMVECKIFVQNDYMNHDPNSRVNIVKDNMYLKENNDYTCLTTDRFITAKHEEGKFMFEMEAYANAEVAKNFNMLDKFYAIKFVSDIVGADAGGHWEKDVKALHSKLVNKIKEISYTK